MGPSIIRTTSVRLISSAARSNLNPPSLPLLLSNKRLFRNSLKIISKNLRGICCSRAMSEVITDSPKVNERVYRLYRKKHILINVADNPPLCDFYVGGIVSKGKLKIAISTNGKSPTLAKRLRQWLEAFLPEETNALLDKLYIYRNRLRGDFEQKVLAMNKLTEKLLEQDD